MKFKCPKCGNNVAEEIITDCTVLNIVLGTEDGEDLEYGHGGEVNGGEISRYQCESCGYVIPNVCGVEEMSEWIRKNGE